MVATEHFVILHVPKTGGSFINHVCRQHLPPSWFVHEELRDHTTLDDIPVDLAALPVLCFVRNPWDWYVSWYHFNMQARTPDSPRSRIWTVLLNSGRASFKEAVTTACLLGRMDELREKASPGGPWWGSFMHERDTDLYTAAHWRVVRDGVESGRVEIGRFENLTEDLLAFLDRHRIPVGSDFHAAVRREPPQLQTERGPYRDYYDEELRALVEQRCNLVRDFQYSY